MKTAGIATTALAGLPILSTSALASNEMGFSFAAPSVFTTGPFTGDVVISNGGGKFGKQTAQGGGRITHLSASGTVVGTATWLARRVASFAQGDTDLGAHAAGVALLEIEIRPDDPAVPRVDATLKIVCNLPGRHPTGDAEGVAYMTPFGDTSQAGGATLFTPGAS